MVFTFLSISSMLLGGLLGLYDSSKKYYSQGISSKADHWISRFWCVFSIHFYSFHFLFFILDKDLYDLQFCSLGITIHQHNLERSSHRILNPERELPLSISADLPLEILIWNERTHELANDIIRLDYDYLFYCYTNVTIYVPNIGCMITLIYRISRPSEYCLLTVCVLFSSLLTLLLSILPIHTAHLVTCWSKLPR